ncbi:hypothetical protein HDE_05022 [Halotydeus destructor]|nr:hypothetical protein HDE_05022 [Halotydeus destructor]
MKHCTPRMGVEPTQFVDHVPDEFICSTCHKVLFDPIVCAKNVRLCKTCSTAHEKTCSCGPNLGDVDWNPQTIPVSFLLRLKELKAKCSFSMYGCENYSLKLIQLRHHEKECVFNPNLNPFIDKYNNLLSQCQERRNQWLSDMNSLREELDKKEYRLNYVSQHTNNIKAEMELLREQTREKDSTINSVNHAMIDLKSKFDMVKLDNISLNERISMQEHQLAEKETLICHFRRKSGGKEIHSSFTTEVELEKTKSELDSLLKCKEKLEWNTQLLLDECHGKTKRIKNLEHQLSLKKNEVAQFRSRVNSSSVAIESSREKYKLWRKVSRKHLKMKSIKGKYNNPHAKTIRELKKKHLRFLHRIKVLQKERLEALKWCKQFKNEWSTVHEALGGVRDYWKATSVHRKLYDAQEISQDAYSIMAWNKLSQYHHFNLTDCHLIEAKRVGRILDTVKDRLKNVDSVLLLVNDLYIGTSIAKILSSSTNPSSPKITMLKPESLCESCVPAQVREMINQGTLVIIDIGDDVMLSLGDLDSYDLIIAEPCNVDVVREVDSATQTLRMATAQISQSHGSRMSYVCTQPEENWAYGLVRNYFPENKITYTMPLRVALDNRLLEVVNKINVAQEDAMRFTKEMSNCY